MKSLYIDTVEKRDQYSSRNHLCQKESNLSEQQGSYFPPFPEGYEFSQRIKLLELFQACSDRICRCAQRALDRLQESLV